MKKMQAMKVAKDNAMDDSDTWEVKAREANTRRAKLEGDLHSVLKGGGLRKCYKRQKLL